MYPHGSHAHRDRPLVASGPSAAMADSLSSISIFPFALILSLSLSFSFFSFFPVSFRFYTPNVKRTLLVSLLLLLWVPERERAAKEKK